MTFESLFASTIVLLVLIITQYPSVPGGDAGELIAESCVNGTAHPPGYPLMLLISNIAIRFGKMIIVFSSRLSNQYQLTNYDFLQTIERVLTPARCTNTLCCLLGALACYYLSESITSQIILSSTKKTNGIIVAASGCGAIGGIVFTLSPLTWEYTRMTEVFALNNCLISLILYLTVQFSKVLKEANPSFRSAMKCSMKGAFVSGLALSNQHTSLLYILPIIPFVIYYLCIIIPSKKKIRWVILAVSVLGLSFLFGLIPYIHLVLSSQIPKPGSWGNQTTWRGLLRHVLRQEYGSFSLAAAKFSEVENSLMRWVAYIVNLFKQFTAFGAFLSLYGVKKGSQITKGLGGHSSGFILLVAMMHYLLWWNGMFSNLPLSHPMANEVLSRFYIQPNMVACFYLGLGCFHFISGMARNMSDSSMAIISRFSFAFVVVLCLGRPHVISTIREPSNDTIVSNHALSVLDSIPKNSLLLSYSDLHWNSVRYFQVCEEERNDVTHLSLQLIPYPWFERQIKLYPHISFPPILDNVSTNRNTDGYSKYLSRLLDANLDNEAITGGVYIEMQAILGTDIHTGGVYMDKFTLIPWGLLYRVLPKEDDDESSNKAIKKWLPKSLFRISKVRERMKNHTLTKVQQGSWEEAALSVFWDMHYQLGLHTLGIALRLGPTMQEDTIVFTKYVQILRVSSKLLLQVDKAYERQNGIVK
jgi:hypothetical protein